MRDHKIFCFLGLGESNVSSTTEFIPTTVTIITTHENDLIASSSIRPLTVESAFSSSGFDEIERSARIIL